MGQKQLKKLRRGLKTTMEKQNYKEGFIQIGEGTFTGQLNKKHVYGQYIMVNEKAHFLRQAKKMLKEQA